MAPLFNAQPLTGINDTEKDDEIDKKLNVDVAMTTLTTLEEVLDGFECQQAKSQKQVKRIKISNIARYVVPFVSAVMLLALATSSVFLLVRARKRFRECVHNYHACKEARAERDATVLEAENVEVEDCEPLLTIQSYSRDLDQACHMTTVTALLGMSIWRWLLFLGLFWPLELVAYFIARCFAFLVHTNLLGKHAIFVTFGLHRQLAYMLRAALWLGMWFAITGRPRSWALQADDWEQKAGRPLWKPTFLKVHAIIWRLLLTFLLYTIVGLLSAAAGKALSLQFHHKNHFERMQNALVHEHIVQLLSQPQNVTKYTTIEVNGRPLELNGYACAHWAALCFVTRIASPRGDLLKHLADYDDESVRELKQRALAVQQRLAQMLCCKYGAEGARITSPTKKASLFNPLFGNSRTGSRVGSRSGSVDIEAEYDKVGTTSQPASPSVSKPSFLTAWSQQHEQEARSPDSPAAQLRALTVRGTQSATAQRADADTTPYASMNLDDNSGGAQPSAKSMPALAMLAKKGIALSPSRSDKRLTARHFIEAAEAALPEETKARRAWSMLRLNASVRKSSRIMASMLSTQRGAAINRVVRRSDEDLEDKPLLAPDEVEVLDDEAQEALEHLCPEDVANPHRSDGYRINLAGRLTKKVRKEVQEKQPPPTNSAVNQLQTYLLGKSYIKVFSLEDAAHGSKDKDSTLKNKLGARQLGYYLFFNLRSERSGLALRRDDVYGTAERAGLRHKDPAWALLDRNGDTFATMDEERIWSSFVSPFAVLDSVEQVYSNRKALARTLKDSQTVVAQVERAIYITLMVICVFIVVAIFDAGSLQRTWTGLSAGLLSFSFIFGNSIRQVFENGVFLFFAHPFDVGDAIKFEDNRYDVNAINLQYVNLTHVLGADVNVPTSEMRVARITNITRSGQSWEGIHVTVDASTTVAQCEHAAGYIAAVMRANIKIFGGYYRIWVSDSLPGHKLKVSVWYNHNTNGLNMEMMGEARTRLNTAIAEGLRAAGVTYSLPPIQDRHTGTLEDVEAHMRKHIASQMSTDNTKSTTAHATNEDPMQTEAAATAMILASQ